MAYDYNNPDRASGGKFHQVDKRGGGPSEASKRSGASIEGGTDKADYPETNRRKGEIHQKFPAKVAGQISSKSSPGISKDKLVERKEKISEKKKGIAFKMGHQINKP